MATESFGFISVAYFLNGLYVNIVLGKHPKSITEEPIYLVTLSFMFYIYIGTRAKSSTSFPIAMI